MQKSEKPATEPEAQRQRRLGLVGKRGVVQMKLLERSAQILVLVRLDRIQPGEHHRLDVLETGDRLAARVPLRSDRIADPFTSAEVFRPDMM